MTAYEGALQRECALRAECTPKIPPQTPWGNPMGNGDPDADDWQVTFLRGEGGFPWTNHFDLLLLHNQMEVGAQRTTSSPPAPVQPDEDVGHLINTLAMGLRLGAPQINTFSSEAVPGKMEVSFEQWYHEVQCVKDHCPESVV